MADVNDIIFWYGKNIIQDSSNRLVTDEQIAKWDNKEYGRILLEDGIDLDTVLEEGKYIYYPKLDNDRNWTNKVTGNFYNELKENYGTFPSVSGRAILVDVIKSIRYHNEYTLQLIYIDEDYIFTRKIDNSGNVSLRLEYITTSGISFDTIGKSGCHIGFMSYNDGNKIERYFGIMKDGCGIMMSTSNYKLWANGGALKCTLENPLTLKIGTSGTSYDYNASSAQTINISPDTIGAAPASHKHSDADITGISASKITGTIDIANLPKGALERLVPVKDDTARLALTTDDVQLGDTIKVESTGLMYYVVDENKLNSEDGYSIYTAGTATSVPWTGVSNKPDAFTPAIHTHTKVDITDFPTSLKNPNAVIIKLNSGTAEGTNMFTYDGSAAKSINITPGDIGAAESNHTHDSKLVTNWNDAITSGTYYAAASAENNPSSDASYSGIVVKGNTIVTQTLIKESDTGDIYQYIRRGTLNSGRTEVSTWGDWAAIQYIIG